MIEIVLVFIINFITTFCTEWTDASWSDYSFMALVYTTKSDGSIGACGGSILSTNECGRGVILTAAHCVEGGTNVRVGIGCTQTSYSCTDAGAKYYDDDYYVIHPSYDSSLPSSDINWLDNDIALIFLSEPITVTNARAISLHSDISVMQNDANIRVFGYYGTCSRYGANCVGGSDTDTLEYADTHYMISTECDDTWGSRVTGGHDFCVRDDDDSKQSICAGDSGSPLLFQNKQIGLNSWGHAYCDPIHPAVATSIPYYHQWITETRAAQPQCKLNLYRYWNGVDHFYTSNYGEIGAGKHGYRLEGIQCQIERAATSDAVTLYRYWNGVDHFYTANYNEIGTGKYGYRMEGSPGKCFSSQSARSGLIPLYRYWNGREHFYTTNAGEIGTTTPGQTGRYGYKSEGITCYVYPRTASQSVDPLPFDDIHGEPLPFDDNGIGYDYRGEKNYILQFSSQSMVYAIGGIICVLLVVNIWCLAYKNCGGGKPSKYTKVAQYASSDDDMKI